MLPEAMPAISSGSAILPKTVREASRLKCWKIIPTSRRIARSAEPRARPTSCPATVTVPLVGRSSPLTMRSRVDLPAPERPMMPQIAPGPIRRDTSSSAVTAWPPLPAKALPTLSKVMAAPVFALSVILFSQEIQT